MIIEQVYTGCLSQGAYYIESAGQAAIIDPLRETEPYIRMAERRGATIKYIFETHFHADFVSGHADLANQTGADIVYGPTQLKTGFDATIAKDGQEFQLGNARIRLIHTPGHTMESSCFLLINEEGKEEALFTGDTLFIGDVGRPDLAQHVISELTPSLLAGHLFDSLRNKIMPLPDHLIVYPAHGAGSACGKNLSGQLSDTLGHQKQTNYALRQDLTREDFIEEVLSGLTQPPGYFPKNVLLNIHGSSPLQAVMESAHHALTPEAFEALANETGALLLDTRSGAEFAKGFVPGSINIAIDGSFAVWAGTLIEDMQQPILIIAEPGREDEVITRLARVGYDQVKGFLADGFASWVIAGKDQDTVQTITAHAFHQRLLANPHLRVIDVRKQSEFESQHLEGAVNVPLDYINEQQHQLHPELSYYIHCAGGYRSMTFISILQARGYRHLINIDGGFGAIRTLPHIGLTSFQQPVTML